MYLNNSEVLHNTQETNKMISYPTGFSSYSQATPSKPGNSQLDDVNGIRMKRYNSLPDVAEYLDPNLPEPNKTPGINYTNPQFNSLMAAFGQNNNDRKHFKPNVVDPRLKAGYSPSPQVSNQFTSNPQLNWNNPSGTKSVTDSPMASQYPGSHMTYESINIMTQPQTNPQFSQVYIPQNMFKTNRNDPSFNNYMYDINRTNVTQPAPTPDPATTQAANDAIAASSQYPPPSEDNADPDQVPRRQHLRYHGDLYTPQWVRGTGHKKEGYCDLCNPGKWLQLKNSAFWYHKQFFHGISSVSGKFFSGPLQTRQKDPDIIEGLCHQCNAWIQMSSPKRRNSVLWFRHSHKCHMYTKPKSVYDKKE